MKLTKKQLFKYKSEIEDTTNYAISLYPNGIFEILDVLDKDKSSILLKLKQLGYLKNLRDINYRKDNDEQLFRITGIIDFDALNETLELHDELNPKLWDKDNQLLPDIAEKITAIVDHFKDQLAENKVELKIDDIYLIGSNVNYNYTDSSDLDVHIIADETFDCSSEHLPIIYDAYKRLFNNKYDIKINDIDVEIYVENKDDLHNVTSGIYSLKNGWIKNPSRYEIPDIDDNELEKLITEWENKYLNIIANPNLDEITAYIDDIYELRGNSLQSEGEFGLGNLVFKEIRRLEYLDNLKDLRDELQGKELSL